MITVLLKRKQLKIGYLSQHEFENDADNNTVLNKFREEVNVSEAEARHILADFMFMGKMF